MYFFSSIIFLALLSIAAIAEIPEPENLEVETISPKEMAVDRLLSERDSSTKFEQAINDAKKVNVSDQAILEARFLYHVDHREDDAIAALLPDFIKQREFFKIEDSAIFSMKEDWLAVNEYVQAIACLRSGDKSSFKTHIMEAFWLSPKQASAFAPHVDRMRLEDAMRDVRVDLGRKFLTVNTALEMDLKSLMVGKKALLFHFWSPASRECVASLPDYGVMAKALDTRGISMVSMLPENSIKILADARTLLKTLDPELPGVWLIDHEKSPLGKDLRVQTLPVFVLISNEGQVLYHGDPTEDKFWDALKKVNLEINRLEIINPEE